MRYRPLGRSGIHISPYALGAMNFGALATRDHDVAVAIIRRALDGGITMIDTADVYSQGESEQIVGKAIKGRRDDVVLATKFANPMGESPNRRGGSRRWVTTAVEESLRRLDTDYIDLYQYHYPDDSTALEETLSVLTDLVRAGKVRAIGTSKQPASALVESHWISEKLGYERFRSEQPHYSMLNRGVERDILPTVQRFGMGAVVWSPLAQGLLTGRVRKGRDSTLTRRGHYFEHLSDERRIDTVEQLVTVADEAGISLTHMAIAFVLAHPGVTAALLGPRTVEQLDDLLAGADVRLDDDVLDRIDAIVAPGTDVGQLQMGYTPSALTVPHLRRRVHDDRVAG
jgi:aryl-alcohol dehydrogenase-like predicted oxidoreductase